jgi:hypothetical protein
MFGSSEVRWRFEREAVGQGDVFGDWSCSWKSKK